MNKTIFLALILLITHVSCAQNHSMRLMNVINADSLSSKVTATYYNGKFLVIGKSNGIIEQWNDMGTKKIKTIKAHSMEITSVTCDNNLTYIASASRDSTLKIWKLESGDEVYSFKDDMLSDPISNLVFNRKLGIIISVNKNNVICTWNTNGFLSADE